MLSFHPASVVLSAGATDKKYITPAVSCGPVSPVRLVTWFDGLIALMFGMFCSVHDASCMPGTTAPECFGIKPREALQIARIAGSYGADILEISELCPIFDVSQMSIKLACCMLYHYLGSRAQTLRAEGKA